MSKIRTFMRLPWRVRWMLCEAVIGSGWYRFVMLHRPFGKIAAHLGQSGLETDDHNPDRQTVRQIAWAVAAVCKRTPWQSKCLVQALTARKMLTRRGISCTLYMGARRNDQGEMQAHAWLRSGTVYVTGGDGKEEYAVTSVFGTERR